MEDDSVNTELIRVALLGDMGVGKTCTLYQLYVSQFHEKCDPTFGVEFAPLIVRLEDGKSIDIQLCDFGGGENSRAMVLSMLKTCPMVVVMYDVTSHASFEHIEKWIADAKEKGPNDVLFSIVGNKSDLQNRAVSTEEGEKLAKKHGASFDEVSAKEATNLQTFIKKVGSALRAHLPQKNS